jgi:hypothetical protein
MTRYYRVAIAIALGVNLAWPVLACDVPVFRYALERWEPDAYQLTLLHSAPLNEGDEVLWDRITQVSNDPSSLNLRIRTSDSGGVADSGLEARWKAEADASTPWLALYYPSRAPLQTYLWAGPLTESNCEALLDSPARQKIAKALLDGDSAVFVLLESGDVDADRTAAEILERELVASEAELALPGATNEEVPDIDESKLEIAFSTVRVSRQDPGERIFVEMLLGSEPGLRDLNAPMVFPVYGRGLALYALAGKGINSKTIRQACAFVTGPCSCQVKDENPGVDILIAMNWDAGIGEFLLQNPEPAALPSPALLQASAPDRSPVGAEPDAPIVAAVTAQATSKVIADVDLRTPGPSPLVTTGIVLAIGMATVALVSFTLYHRKH